MRNLDFDYDEAAPEPAEFIKFLYQLWPDDDELINTLQQIFGLLLTSDTSFQKAFMLIGPRRSGKGTIGRVLGKLLGKGSICALKLKDLGTDFGRWPLIGKLLAIVSDARLKGRIDKSAIAEELLSITGEDYRTINRKHIAPWIGQLLSRFLIISNELPQIEDMSGALASRFIVLILKISFYGHEDRDITNRLYTEMPGILNWAIEGWDKLQKAGKFTQPSASAAAIQRLEDLGSPIKAFVRDQCEMGANYSVEKNKLYSAWLQWCDERGHRFTTTDHVFGRDLYVCFPRCGRDAAG